MAVVSTQPNQTKVAVFGCGLIGHAIALDLAADPTLDVTICDLDESKLAALRDRAKLSAWICDLSDNDSARALASRFDIIVNATPGFLGFNVLRSIIEAGKNVVDIAFCPEDALELHSLAETNNVIAITDCGVAPGLSNIWIAEATTKLDEVDSAVIYVGGLPADPKPPFFYKAVFSPSDVIELYTRPARYIENGKLIIKPALTDVERIAVHGVGELEAFNTDGLRSLAHTIKAKTIKEKTLRYPGHLEKIQFLSDLGLFSEQPLQMEGIEMRPIDVTSKLLFPLWEMQPHDQDLTVMRVIVSGYESGAKQTLTYDLLDRYDVKTNMTSMARTTGFTASAAVNLIRTGKFTRKGVSPAEHIGFAPQALHALTAYLADREVRWSLLTSC